MHFSSNTTRARIAVGYLRCSTEQQSDSGLGLDAQRERIAAWCDANGYTLAEVFTDAGLSGKRADNRPGLRSALEAVCRPDNAALVVYSLSRLARSTRDAITIAERLEKAGADLVSLSERIDTTSAAGKMVFRMLAVLAEFERDLVSERTYAALAVKRARGQRVGTVPYGCDLADDGATLVENPREQRVIRAIGRMRSRGDSLERIAARLTAFGIPTKTGKATAWTHQAVNRIAARRADSVGGNAVPPARGTA
jgi:DNA invertase Pin-like site-specific DNA recombinase